MTKTTPDSNSINNKEETRISPVTWMVFLLGWVFYYSLRSWDFYAADGALRALQALRAEKIFFHDNNHMLYPLWFYLWGKLLNLFCQSQSDPVALMRSAQGLNCLLSAGILAVLHHLFRQIVGTSRALLGIGVFGLSYAFFKHATNSAEVIPGVFFGVLGLCWMVAGIRRNAIPPLVISGVWLALALASYQSMGQLALIGTVICCNLPANRMQARLPLTVMMSRLLWVGIGGSLGICAIYGWAYHMQGVPLNRMVSRFFMLGSGSDAYFGFFLSRALHLPLGYLNGWYNLFPPDANGIRATIARPDAAIWVCWIAAGTLLVGSIALRITRGWWLMCSDRSPVWPVTTAIAGLGLALPLLCWDPYYDKLLILPLMGSVSIGLAVLGHSGLTPNAKWTQYGPVVGLLILELLAVTGHTIWERKNPKTYLNDAKVVSSIVRPNDWVVLEFDPVSCYFSAMFSTNGNRLVSLPLLSREAAQSWLINAKAHCERGFDRLLFLGVLEMDRKNWDTFVGRVGGMQYDDLNLERTSAKELARFKNGQHWIVLYEVPVQPVSPK